MSEFFKAVEQYESPKKLKYYILLDGVSVVYAGTEKKENAIEIDKDSYRNIIIAGKENLIFQNGKISNKKIKSNKIIEQELIKSNSQGYILLGNNPFWVLKQDKIDGEAYKWQTLSE
jgi:hypothetical protein